MALVNDVAVQLGGSGYRIRQGTAFSEVSDFGEPVEWKAPNGKTYIAFFDLPDGEDDVSAVETPFEVNVYEVKAIPGEIEEVEFEGDEDEEDEGDDSDDGSDDGDEGEDGGDEHTV
jgi:hypothetical protein